MAKDGDRSDDDRERILAEINRAIAAGETVREAVAKAGIAYPTYYSWAQKYGHNRDSSPRGRRTVPRYAEQAIIGVPSGQVMVVLGDVDDVQKVVESMMRDRKLS